MPSGILNPVVSLKRAFSKIDDFADNQLIRRKTSADYGGRNMNMAPDNDGAERD